MIDMKPGPELDRAVAEAVGWLWIGNAVERIGDETYVARYPSGSDADAIAALEATGDLWDITRFRDHFEVAFFDTLRSDRNGLSWPCGIASTIRIAACAAILAWKEASRD